MPIVIDVIVIIVVATLFTVNIVVAAYELILLSCGGTTASKRLITIQVHIVHGRSLG